MKCKAQLDYQQTVIQSGVAYEVARWQGAPGSFTALDVLGSARYWNQDLNLSVHLTGTLEADFRRLGLKFKRSRSVATARASDLEWVDPVVGARVRHQIAPGKDLNLEGDIGASVWAVSSRGRSWERTDFTRAATERTASTSCSMDQRSA